MRWRICVRYQAAAMVPLLSPGMPRHRDTLVKLPHYVRAEPLRTMMQASCAGNSNSRRHVLM
jgi:hypothetical protein